MVYCSPVNLPIAIVVTCSAGAVYYNCKLLVHEKWIFYGLVIAKVIVCSWIRTCTLTLQLIVRLENGMSLMFVQLGNTYECLTFGRELKLRNFSNLIATPVIAPWCMTDTIIMGKCIIATNYQSFRTLKTITSTITNTLYNYIVCIL